jgi:hypothetical protein
MWSTDSDVTNQSCSLVLVLALVMGLDLVSRDCPFRLLTVEIIVPFFPHRASRRSMSKTHIQLPHRSAQTA